MSTSIENSVSTRSNVSVEGVITSSNVIIEDVIFGLALNDDVTGLTPSSLQEIVFTNDSETEVVLSFAVSSFEVIIEDVIFGLVIGENDLTGLQVKPNQVLNFIE